MGAVMTKLEKEDKKQEEWRKIITGKVSPENSGAEQKSNQAAGPYKFEEMHFLRGGKGRVCVCPSLIWPDNYSLIMDPTALAPYLEHLVTADVVVVWNLNNRNLTREGRYKYPEKTHGTNYVEVLPHVLRALVSARLEPMVVNFQDCDFSKCSDELFKDFLCSQVGRLDEMTFHGCEGMPLRNNLYENVRNSAARKISVRSVQSLKLTPDEKLEDIVEQTSFSEPSDGGSTQDSAFVED